MYVVLFSALVVNQEKFEDGSWREAAQFFPPSQSRVSSQSHPSVIAPFPKMGQFPKSGLGICAIDDGRHTVLNSAKTCGLSKEGRYCTVITDRSWDMSYDSDCSWLG
jgi:hypothetical protein